jgi:hypothetical protein
VGGGGEEKMNPQIKKKGNIKIIPTQG